MGKEEEVGGGLNLVPEVYVDIISRIIPGGVFLAGIIYFTKGSLDLDIVSCAVGIAVAYVVGFALDTLTAGLAEKRGMKASWKVFSRYSKQLSEKKVASLLGQLKIEMKVVESGEIMAADYESQKFVLESVRDWVRQNRQREGAILMKLVAEERLMRNVAVGLPLAMLIAGWRIWSSEGHLAKFLSFENIVLALFAEVVLIYGGRKRMERTVARTFWWWVGYGWQERNGAVIGKEAPPIPRED